MLKWGHIGKSNNQVSSLDNSGTAMAQCKQWGGSVQYLNAFGTRKAPAWHWWAKHLCLPLTCKRESCVRDPQPFQLVQTSLWQGWTLLFSVGLGLCLFWAHRDALGEEHTPFSFLIWWSSSQTSKTSRLSNETQVLIKFHALILDSEM